jgi:hypothetical protein
MRIASITILLLSATVWSAVSPARAATPMSEDAACARLKEHVALTSSLPKSGPVGGWFCDFVPYEEKEWFVIALRSNRACEGICSNLMGWYAVDRRTGALHDFDVAEYRIGTELTHN